MTGTLSWRRGDLEFKASSFFDPLKHPRNSQGQFIETGAEVRTTLGTLGTAVRSMSGDRVLIKLANGKHVAVDKDALTVIKRADGSAPTKSAAEAKPLAEGTDADAPDDVEEEAAPAKPAKPDAAKPDAGKPADPKRPGRFDTVERLRDFYKTHETGDPKADAAMRHLANDQSLSLAEGGTLVVQKNGKTWRVFHAGTGLLMGPAAVIPEGSGGKRAALKLAARFETEMRGPDDKQFDWAAHTNTADLGAALKDWKSKDGDGLGSALMKVRDRFDAGDTDADAPSSKPADAPGGETDGLRPAGAEALRDVAAAQPGEGAGAGAAGDVRESRGGSGEPGRADGGRDRGADAQGERPDAGRGAVRGDGGPAGDRADAGRGRSAPDAADAGSPARRARRGRAKPADAGDGPGGMDEPRPGRRIGRGLDANTPRFQPEGQEDLAPSSPRDRAAANMEALRTLRVLQAENRPATADEQAVLARWGGWGAVKQVFDEAGEQLAAKAATEGREPTPEEQRIIDALAPFDATRAELKRILSTKEYNAARRNMVNAHYTDPAMAQALWDGLKALGFDGGRVLEPGSGAGTFIGLRPEGVDMVGVELDPITAGISEHLYPDANVLNQGFELTRMPKGSFDAAIGNVPFGKFALNDSKYNAAGHSIHNHFILKALRMTRPGGMVAMLTSRQTLDSLSEDARKELHNYGDFVGAVRLPTGSHRRASGTDVVIDAVVFRARAYTPPPKSPVALSERDQENPDKMAVYNAAMGAWQRDMDAYRQREGGRDKSWLKTGEVQTETGPVTMSQWFIDHPDLVLGDVEYTQGQGGRDDVAVRGDKDPAKVTAGLRSALARVKVMAEAKHLLANKRSKFEPLPSIIDTGAAHLEGHLTEGTKVFERAVTHGKDGKELAKPRVEKTTFSQVTNGAVTPHFIPSTQAAELRGLIGLRDAAAQLLDLESTTDEDTDEIEALRAELNRRYDAYSAEFGPVNRFSVSETSRVLAKDTLDDATGEILEAGTEVSTTTQLTPGQGKFRRTRKASLVYALEKFDPETQTARKASIFTQRTVAPREPRLAADTPSDALSITMDTTADVNLRMIADLLGVDEPQARQQLGTLVFDDPTEDVPDRLVPAAEYLSGDIRQKLREAQALAEQDPARYTTNVRALEAVKPVDLVPEQIKARLGVPWIDDTDITRFLRETLSTENVKAKKLGSEWEVKGEPGPLGYTVWGTEQVSSLKIAKAALEGKTLEVKEIDPNTGKPGSKVDVVATDDAQAKVEELNDRFSAWLWEDPERSERLLKLYNDRYNTLVLRQYDTDAAREMPGLAKKYTLRAHQHAAINRIVAEPSVLLAHEVGAGKTLEMIGGSQELRRLGLAKKPAIVVPNHMLEQFSREYMDAYPDANLLIATKDQMQGQSRREFVARAATGNWDAVIITHSAFEKIPLSPEAQEAYIDKEMQVYRSEADAKRAAALADDPAQAKKKTQNAMASIEAWLIKAEQRMRKKLESDRDEDAVSFEETGIDYLMVDEAHLYKNLMTPSNVQGVSIEGSQRAADLHMKLDYLRSRNESNRVVTFATATPVSNSMAEMYIMARYLRPDLLEAHKVRTFDDWSAMHGEMVSDVEIKAGGGFKMKSRLARFRNVPELLRVFHTFSDVKTARDLGLPTPKRRTHTIAVDASDELVAYIQTLGERADALQGKRRPGKGEDNHLAINTDGRKAALDLRLVGVKGAGNPKLDAAADKIAEIYEQHKDRKYKVEGTQAKDPITGHLIKESGEVHDTPGALQIVFSDLGTPGGKRKVLVTDANGLAILNEKDEPQYTLEPVTWNVYGEVKDLLAARGVPRDQIRFIHEAKSDADKARLFEDARTGKIAVLIGSTAKMGVGTNVQNRAVALHHLECPWRPTDLTQRDGRIERQGNQNEEIDVYRYVVKDSFDAKSWKTVTQKQGYIEQVLTGTLDQREIEDVGTSAQSLDEVTAIAANNPHLSEQIRNNAGLKRLERQDRAFGFAQQSLRSNETKYTEAIANADKLTVELDAALAKWTDTSGDKFVMTSGRPVGDGLYSKQFSTEGGEQVDNRKDAAEQLAANIALVRDGRFYEPQAVANIGGFDIMAEKQWDYLASGYTMSLRIDGISGGVIKADAEDLSQVILTIESRLRDIPTKRERTIEARESAVQRRAAVQKNIGGSFAKADELEYVRGRAKILARIMGLYAGTDKRDNEKIGEEDQKLRAFDTQYRAQRRDAAPDAVEVAPVALDEDPDLAELLAEPDPIPVSAPPRIGRPVSPAAPGLDVRSPEEIRPKTAPAAKMNTEAIRDEIASLEATGGDRDEVADRLTQLRTEASQRETGPDPEFRGRPSPAAADKPAALPPVEARAPKLAPADAEEWRQRISDAAFTLSDSAESSKTRRFRQAAAAFLSAWEGGKGPATRSEGTALRDLAKRIAASSTDDPGLSTRMTGIADAVDEVLRRPAATDTDAPDVDVPKAPRTPASELEPDALKAETVELEAVGAVDLPEPDAVRLEQLQGEQNRRDAEEAPTPEPAPAPDAVETSADDFERSDALIGDAIGAASDEDYDRALELIDEAEAAAPGTNRSQIRAKIRAKKKRAEVRSAKNPPPATGADRPDPLSLLGEEQGAALLSGVVARHEVFKELDRGDFDAKRVEQSITKYRDAFSRVEDALVVDPASVEVGDYVDVEGLSDSGGEATGYGYVRAIKPVDVRGRPALEFEVTQLRDHVSGSRVRVFDARYAGNRVARLPDPDPQTAAVPESAEPAPVNAAPTVQELNERAERVADEAATAAEFGDFGRALELLDAAEKIGVVTHVDELRDEYRAGNRRGVVDPADRQMQADNLARAKAGIRPRNVRTSAVGNLAMAGGNSDTTLPIAQALVDAATSGDVRYVIPTTLGWANASHTNTVYGGSSYEVQPDGSVWDVRNETVDVPASRVRVPDAEVSRILDRHVKPKRPAADDVVIVQDVPLVEATPDVLGEDESAGQLGLDLGAATEQIGQLGLGLGLEAPVAKPKPKPKPAAPVNVPGQLGFEEEPDDAPAAPARPVEPATTTPTLSGLPADIHGWETTKPWNIDRATLQLHGLDGFRHSPHGHGEDASHGPDGKIVLTDKFFAHAEETRRAILYHEAGHALSDAMLEDGSAFTLFDALPVGPLGKREFNGRTTPGEAAAEAYSVLNSTDDGDRAWAKRMNVEAYLSAVADHAERYQLPMQWRPPAAQATQSDVPGEVDRISEQARRDVDSAVDELIKRETEAELTREERDAEAKRLAAESNEAFKAGDYERALELVDQAEAVAPEYKGGAERWTQIRDIIRLRLQAQQAEAAEQAAARPKRPAAPAVARPTATDLQSWTVTTGLAADVLDRLGDPASANALRWAADRRADAWRYGDTDEQARTAAAVNEVLDAATSLHDDDDNTVDRLNAVRTMLGTPLPARRVPEPVAAPAEPVVAAPAAPVAPQAPQAPAVPEVAVPAAPKPAAAEVDDRADVIAVAGQWSDPEGVEAAGYQFGAEGAQIGDVAVVRSQGAWRRGIITEVRPNGVLVRYVSQSSVNRAARSNATNPGQGPLNGQFAAADLTRFAKFEDAAIEAPTRATPPAAVTPDVPAAPAAAAPVPAPAVAEPEPRSLPQIAPVPATAGADAAAALPLRTSERRVVDSLNLDSTHPDPLVQAAAAAVRAKGSMDADQAEALAKALRAQDTVGMGVAERNRVESSAARAWLLAGHLRTLDDDDTARRSPSSLAAGDRVVVPDFGDGQAVTGEVTATRLIHSKRVVELEIRDDATGDIVTRQLLLATRIKEAGELGSAAPVETAPEPVAEERPPQLDLAAIADETLARLLGDYGDDQEMVDAILAELERRDAVSDATPESSLLDQLLADGEDFKAAYAEAYGIDPDVLDRQERISALRVEARAGETVDDVAKRLYQERIYLQMIAADIATNGYMLSREGVAKGIKPIELFSGRADQARLYASEELKRFWADVDPRITWTEFAALVLGRDRDIRAAANIAAAGNDRDFGL